MNKINLNVKLNYLQNSSSLVLKCTWYWLFIYRTNFTVVKIYNILELKFNSMLIVFIVFNF